jgi:hypothetical protein
MDSPLPEEFQKDFNVVRNKQVEIFDRLGRLEGQQRQLTESMRKLEEIVQKTTRSAGTPTSAN